MKRLGLLAALVVCFTLSSRPAAAHHGWSGQRSDQIDVTGTVESGVRLNGPHATMKIRDADGRLWDVTLAPSGRTQRAGLAEDTIPVGATVTVRGNRNSDPDRYEIKTVRVTYGDVNYDVYPDRIS